MRVVPIVTALAILLAGGGATAREKGCEGPGCLPTLTQHGRIAGAAPVEPPDIVNPKSSAPPAAVRQPPTEKSPGAEAARAEEPPPYDPGDFVFTTSLDRNVASLGECRLDVARARGVGAASLPEDVAYLHVVVAPDGKVVRSTLSTSGAIGQDFADCLKKRVHAWDLTRPRGQHGALVDLAAKIGATGRTEIMPGLRVPLS